ncbi:MAG: carboxypeptidase regulatory-like domain-containing protein [Tepidisphaeraceae bacterium]
MKSCLLGLAIAAALGVCCVARAQITGKVMLDGKAPDAREIDMKGVPDCAKLHADPVFEETIVAGDKGELKNVVISIKTDDPSSLGGEAPKTPAVLDQKGCTYEPHVLAVMVGQEMKVKNDDPFLHNVHSLANNNPNFNFGQPNKDEGKKVDSPKVAENFKIKCDVHPWMGAYVAVFEHPFFAVSGDDGSFTIPGTLPDGEYAVTAWHESLGTQEGKVTVSGGKGTVEFKFAAPGAMAPDGNPARIMLASDQKSGCDAGTCCKDSRAAAVTATQGK